MIVSNINNKSIEIPDVRGLEVSEAEAEIEKAGLSVNVKTEKIESDEYDEGEVVKTEPAIGRTVKKSTKITLYESIGEKTIEIENYIGEDANQIKAELEVAGLTVKIVTKDVDNVTSDKEDIIVDQTPSSGEKLNKGDTITLYVPNMHTYPDMVSEGWTREEAEDFASKYSLTLTVNEKESSTSPEGTVIWQSRRAGTTISSGASFSITIATAPEIEEVPDDDSEKEEQNNQGNKEEQEENTTTSTDKTTSTTPNSTNKQEDKKS